LAMDQTSWVTIALSAAWAKLNPLDVDLHLTIAPTTDLSSASPPTGLSSTTATGKDLVWHVANVTDTGTDIFANLKLNGLTNGEVRPVATNAFVTYTDPYSAQIVTHP